MEERQDRHQHIVTPQAKDLVERVDVRADIAVREHHSLRSAGCARSEDHGQYVVGLDAGQREPPFQQADGSEPSGDSRNELVPPGNLALQVLEVNEIGCRC